MGLILASAATLHAKLAHPSPQIAQPATPTPPSPISKQPSATAQQLAHAEPIAHNTTTVI